MKARGFKGNSLNKLLCFVLTAAMVFLLLPVTGLADSFQPFPEESSSVTLRDADDPVRVTSTAAQIFVDVPEGKPAVTVTNGIYAGSGYSIYKVADVSGYAHFDKVSEYGAVSGDPDISRLQTFTDTDWSTVSAAVYAYTLEHNVEPTAKCILSEDGICRFNGLETGLYLVADINNKADPFLLCLPDLNIGTRDWNYDVTADPLSPTIGLLDPSAPSGESVETINRETTCSLTLRTVTLGIPADGEADITAGSKTYRYINSSADTVTVSVRSDGVIRTVLNDSTEPSDLPDGSYEACRIRTDGDTISYTFLADLDAALDKANVKSGDVVFLNTAIDPTTAGYVRTGDGIDVYTAQGNLAKNHGARDDVDYEIEGVSDLHTVDSRERAKKYGLDQSGAPQFAEYMYVRISNENEDGHVEIQAVIPDSGGEAVPRYSANAAESVNGQVAFSTKNAESGETVLLTVTPEMGYALDTLRVTNENGTEIKLTKISYNTYSFQMPAAGVKAAATFKETNRFSDVNTGDWFCDAVLWAAGYGITNGTDETHFSPFETGTRAQALTFLWRAAGSPVVNYAMQFTDVEENAYCTDALQWAAFNGIMKGTSGTTAEPDADITREQLAVMLYNYAKSKGEGFSGDWMFLLDYDDVGEISEWANEAMHWCVMKGIINGVGDNRLAPQETANRAEIVTMLYRYFVLCK